MKKQIKGSAAKVGKPTVETPTDSKPVLIFNFENNWPEAPNALFVDESSRQFYIGDFKDSGEFADLEPVTISNALKWYAEANKYSNEGSSGSISELCAAAAEELRDIEQHRANRNLVQYFPKGQGTPAPR